MANQILTSKKVQEVCEGIVNSLSEKEIQTKTKELPDSLVETLKKVYTKNSSKHNIT